MMKLSQELRSDVDFAVSEDSEKPGLQRGLPPSFQKRWQQWEQQVSSSLQEPKGYECGLRHRCGYRDGSDEPEKKSLGVAQA